MHAELRPTTWVLRIFERGQTHGDPYSWACSVEQIDENTIELMGVMIPPSPSVWRAIRKMADDRQWTIIFRRIRKNGDIRVKVVKPRRT